MPLKKQLRAVIPEGLMPARLKRTARKTYRRLRHFSPLPREARYAIVVAQERAGSTLFMDLLNCHPTIIADPHHFYDPERWPQRYRKGRRVFSRAPVRCYKFKIANTPRQSSVQSARASLQQLSEEVAIVRLKRENKFRQALSSRVTDVTGVLHHRDENKGRTVQTLRVDTDRLLETMHYFTVQVAFEDEAFEGIPHLTVVYEDDLFREGTHQATMNRVFEYLGLSAHPVEARTSRIAKPKVSEYVSNYEEVAEALKQNGYGHFLNRVASAE